MQSFLLKLYSAFADFISISNIKKILLKLKVYWQSADVPGKMLIVVFFTPSLFVLLWLLFEIAYFVVFTLPGIVIKLIAQILLFGVFWTAAVYFYEKLRGVMSEKTVKAEKADGTQNMGNNDPDGEKNSNDTERRKDSLRRTIRN